MVASDQMNREVNRVMHRFAQKTELLTHARDHVSNRVNSLESNASHCLLRDSGIAPFPALLYCFATVDL